MTKVEKNGTLISKVFRQVVKTSNNGREIWFEDVMIMGKKTGKVYVVGHKNPDTDSICSAIAYANLKKQLTGSEYVARRAGQINEETHYVLNRFKVDPPDLLSNVKLQVKDIDIQIGRAHV